MRSTYATSYKTLKDLVHNMKAAGLNGFDVLVSQPSAPFLQDGDRETFKITGTKIVVPPIWDPPDQPEKYHYNDPRPFSIQLNGEGIDEPAEPWIDVDPERDIWVVIEPVIFYKLTVRNSSTFGGMDHPVHLHIYQDPQFINQINEFVESGK